MNLHYFIDRLSKNRGVFERLLSGVRLEQARWKPSPDKWSMLEVINHLYDEEREDFRQRIEIVLADPNQAWPRIDPRTWVTTRGYNERELDTSLKNFLAEREKSLAWLEQYPHRIGRTAMKVRMDCLPPEIFWLPGWLTTSFT